MIRGDLNQFGLVRSNLCEMFGLRAAAAARCPDSMFAQESPPSRPPPEISPGFTLILLSDSIEFDSLSSFSSPCPSPPQHPSSSSYSSFLSPISIFTSSSHSLILLPLVDLDKVAASPCWR